MHLVSVIINCSFGVFLEILLATFWMSVLGDRNLAQFLHVRSWYSCNTPSPSSYPPILVMLI